MRMEGILRITAIPTWKCSFNCSYCDYKYEEKDDHYILHAFDKDTKIKDHSAEEWAEFFSSIRQSAVVDFTGGEPTLFPNFDKILKSLENQRWAITSNLSNYEVMLPFVDSCGSITASFHPTQTSRNWFEKRLEDLRLHSFNVQVNIVAMPSNLDKIMPHVKHFEQMGYETNVLPFLTRNWNWDNYPEKKKKLLDLYSGYMHGEKLYWDTQQKRMLCTAGVDYITIDPNGDVFRCYSHMIDRKPRLGNIFDKTFKFLSKPMECNGPCYLICDYDRPKQVLK